MDYAILTVAELRNEFRKRWSKELYPGYGGWLVTAKQIPLIECLESGKLPNIGVHNASTPPAAGMDLAAIIGAAIAPYVANTLNEERVLELIEQALATRPNTKIDVTYNGRAAVTLDQQHENFPLLLHRMKCRTHTWLVGPAGSGKTTAAENVAKALSLPFYFTGAIDNEYKLTGFVDAQGRYVSKQFRQAYEHGGIFLFDEIDVSLKPAVMAFNGALANSACDFPDGSVKRHSDFVAIAAANTFNGSTADYQRDKQDGSTLDRFAYLAWNYDEKLERSILASTYPDQIPWLDYVQKVRANCKLHGVSHIVSPRATFEGAKSQANGGTWDQDVNDFIRKGLSDALWRKVCAA